MSNGIERWAAVPPGTDGAPLARGLETLLGVALERGPERPPAVPYEAIVAEVSRRGREADLRALHERLMAMESENRGLRIELDAARADAEKARAEYERRIEAAAKEARREAHRTSRHGGRLPSILAVD